MDVIHELAAALCFYVYPSVSEKYREVMSAGFVDVVYVCSFSAYLRSIRTSEFMCILQ